jgi:hypothetical protein
MVLASENKIYGIDASFSRPTVFQHFIDACVEYNVGPVLSDTSVLLKL